MAIDDNTSYELTGYQVKDLAQKIRAKADSASLASVATSGLYSDLTGAPTIPTVYNGTLTIQQNGTTVGTFTANQSSAATISLTDTTYSTMTGATSGTAGTSGLVPAPASGDQNKFLSGAGTWVDIAGSYSTTEQKTPFTWLDGKPIYKKTYSMGALINGGGTLVQNISSLNFESVVELRGIAINPTSKNVRPLPCVANGLSDMVRLDVSNNEIHVITTAGSSWSTTYNAYVTLWYTKTS